MLKTHGRYDYSAISRRPDYTWPGGKRLAVHIALNVEHFAFGEGLGNDYAVPHPVESKNPKHLPAQCLLHRAEGRALIVLTGRYGCLRWVERWWLLTQWR